MCPSFRDGQVISHAHPDHSPSAIRTPFSLLRFLLLPFDLFFSDQSSFPQWPHRHPSTHSLSFYITRDFYRPFSATSAMLFTETELDMRNYSVAALRHFGPGLTRGSGGWSVRRVNWPSRARACPRSIPPRTVWKPQPQSGGLLIDWGPWSQRAARAAPRDNVEVPPHPRRIRFHPRI